MCQRCKGFSYKNLFSGCWRNTKTCFGFFTPGVINHIPFASLRELLRCKTSFKKFSLTRVCPWPLNCNCGTNNSNLRPTMQSFELFHRFGKSFLCRQRWQQPVLQTFEEGVSVQRDNSLNCRTAMWQKCPCPHSDVRRIAISHCGGVRVKKPKLVF